MGLRKPAIRADDLALIADVMGWVWATWAFWVALIMLLSGDDLTSPAWEWLTHFPGHYYFVGGVLMTVSLLTATGLILARVILTTIGIFSIGAWTAGLSYQLAAATRHGTNTGTLSSSAWLLIGLLCFFHVGLLIRGRR